MSVIEYRFGDYCLSGRNIDLFCNGRLIPLTKRKYEILKYFVAHSGQGSTREELMLAVWGRAIVDDSNLAQQIYKLRQILGDDPRSPSYLVTIPGVGYLFRAEVTVIPEEIVAVEEPKQEVEEETAEKPVEAAEVETLTPQPVAVTALPRRPGRLAYRWAMLLVATIAVSFASIGVIRAGLIGRISKEHARPQITPLLTMSGTKYGARFSPDGKLIAFVWDEDSRRGCDIFVRMVNDGEAVRVTNSPGQCESFLAWSPDGSRLAFARGESQSPKFQIYVVPTLGGSEQKIGEASGGLDWSPDGKWLAVSHSESASKSTGTWLLSVDGSERHPVTSPADFPPSYESIPRFSRDGRSLAFIRCSGEDNCDIFVSNLSSGEVKRLTFIQKPIKSLQWSPDGADILFASFADGRGRMWRVGADGRGGSPISDMPSGIEQFDIASNSGLIAFNERSINTLIEIDHSPATKSDNSDGKTTSRSHAPCIIDSSQLDNTARFSPDGQWIVFDSNRSGWNELWLATSDCQKVTSLTSFRELRVGSARWSPDGRSITFSRGIDGQGEIMTIDRDGKNLKQLTSNLANDILPSWSADGKWIYFTSDRHNGTQIWKMPAEGGEPIQVTVNGGFEAVESPNGARLYYSWKNLLWQKDLPSGEEMVIPELKRMIVTRHWSVTANAIFYVLQRQPSQSVFRFDLASRNITEVKKIQGEVTYLPAIGVSPDESLLAVSYSNHRHGDVWVISGWDK